VNGDPLCATPIRMQRDAKKPNAPAVVGAMLRRVKLGAPTAVIVGATVTTERPASTMPTLGGDGLRQRGFSLER
jgi:hypothetical protein